MDDTHETPDAPQSASRNALHATVNAQRLALERATDAVERKATSFLGFEAVFLALILGTLSPSPGHVMDVILSYTSLALLLAGALLLTLVVFPRLYRFDPDPESLAQHYWSAGDAKLLDQVSVNLTSAWKQNFRVHERKANLLKWAIALVVAGMSVLAFDVFVVRLFGL